MLEGALLLGLIGQYNRAFGFTTADRGIEKGHGEFLNSIQNPI